MNRVCKLHALPLVVGGALMVSGCASNYAVEGAAAGAAAGAAVSAITGGDALTGAAIGAAAGAIGGHFIDKNKGCDGYDSKGRLDDDCYGSRGYPQRPD